MTRAIVLGCLIAAMVGCGSDEARKAQPAEAESTVSPPTHAEPPPASAKPASPDPTGRLRPLTLAQRKQLRAIGTSIDTVVVKYDSAVRACSYQPSCVDAAFALVVADLDWPPYYLQRIGARQRDCEPLTSAATGIYGFNLGVRQLDYAAPAEDGTRQRDEGALVDGLRYVPDDLRSAAASGCR